jgi:hypothetical protein
MRKMCLRVGFAASALFFSATAAATPSWHQISGCASSISQGSLGDLWVIDCLNGRTDGSVFHRENGSWVEKAGSGVQISISRDDGSGDGGNPWVIQSNGNIFEWTGSSYTQRSGCARSITVGPSNDAWITGCDTNTNHTIYRWNGSSFAQVSPSGVAVQLGTGWYPAGTGGIGTWATQSNGNIYAWNGSGWVAEGSNGASITSQYVVASGSVYSWSYAAQTWSLYIGPTPVHAIKQIAYATFDSASLAAIDVVGNIYQAY